MAPLHRVALHHVLRTAIVLALLALTACAGNDAVAPRAAPPDAPRASATPADPAAPQLDLAGLVARLADADAERRDAAVDELRGLAHTELTTEQRTFLLRAAAKKYPPQKMDIVTTQADLIRVAGVKPEAALVPVVRDLFPSLEPRARQDAFDLLAAVEVEAGATTLLDLLEATVAAGDVAPLHLQRLEIAPKHAKIYFPRILRSAKGDATWGVFSLCLAYANAGAVDASELAPHAKVLLDAYSPMRPEIAAAQGKLSPHNFWNESYASVRARAGIALDLMGFFPSPQVEVALVEASKLKDPRLVFFATTSLLRHGRMVDPKTIEFVAADPEMRAWLFEHVNANGMRGLFPQKWATQEALAESKMVRWLCYPTELGRPPDEIKLMNVVDQDFGPPDGVM